MAHKRKKDDKDIDELTMLSFGLFASFHLKFYYLETNLRLKLFNLLKNQLGTDWFAHQLNQENKDTLFKREAELIRQRKRKDFVVKDSTLLAEASLGFWVEFFNPRIYKATRGVPIQIFSHLPSQVKRKDLYRMLHLVKDLRNKIVHHRYPTFISKRETKYLEEIGFADEALTQLLQWLGVSNWSKITLGETEVIIKKLQDKLISLNEA